MKVSPPVDPTTEYLPLNDKNFTWTNFEAFCRAFIESHTGKPCYHYGVSGNKQNGIDLYVDLEDGRHVFQCKQYKSFSVAQFLKAKNETIYPAISFTVLVACEVGAKVRDEVDKYPNWALWDLRDISNKVKELPSPSARKLVRQRISPQWVSRFLGVSQDFCLQTKKDRFADLLDKKRYFNHSWRFAGRKKEIKALTKFVDGEKYICCLPGRGTSGKSKLLFELATRLEKKKGTDYCWFLSDTFDSNSLEELPESGALIFVDDANKVNSLGTLLRNARGRNIKIILSYRTYSASRVNTFILDADVDSSEIEYLEPLNSLSLQESKSLASQVLKDEQQIEQLVKLTKDSPLALLIGARLMSEGKIHPNLLTTTSEFHNEVFKRFTDIVTGSSLTGLDNQVYRRILQVFAALSPVRVDGDSVERISKYLNIEQIVLKKELDSLEKLGILLRVGKTLRLVPDVLSDYLLTEACITNQKESSGFAEQLFSTFGYSKSLLTNLAELDWQAQSTEGIGQSLLKSIWKTVQNQFAQGDYYDRVSIMKSVEAIARFQIEAAFDFVARAMVTYKQEINSSRSSLRDSIVDILKDLSRSIDYLEPCCNYLWELGRDDIRALNSNPEHGARALADMISYKIGKPILYQELILAWLEKLLSSEDCHNYHCSPLKIVSELLEKDGDQASGNGAEWSFIQFPVPEKTVRHLRKRALSLLEKALYSNNAKAVSTAINHLEHALSMSPKGNNQDWDNERLEVLKVFEKRLVSTENLALKQEILNSIRKYHPYFKSDKVRMRAEKIIARVEYSLEQELMDHLHKSRYEEQYSRRVWNNNLSFEQIRQEEHNKKLDLIKRFVQAYAEPEEGYLKLNEIIEKSISMNVELNVFPVLGALGSEFPEYSARILEKIIVGSNITLIHGLPALIEGIRKSKLNLGFECTDKAIESARIEVLQSIAYGFHCMQWTRENHKEDFDRAFSLLEIDDDSIRISIIGGFRFASKERHHEILNRILSCPLEGKLNVILSLCSIIEEEHSLSPRSLNKQQLEHILHLVGELDSLRTADIRYFLSKISNVFPEELIQMYLDRIRKERESGRFSLLPDQYGHEKLFSKITDEERIRLLEHLSEEALKYDEVPYSFATLFEMVSNDYEQLSVHWLQNWISVQPDKERLICASVFLGQAGLEFSVNNAEFTTFYLDTAFRLDPELYDRLETGFYCAVRTSSRAIGSVSKEHSSLLKGASEAVNKLPPGPARNYFLKVQQFAEAEIKDDALSDEELMYDG